jgi:histidine triad (HIT) family protein
MRALVYHAMILSMTNEIKDEKECIFCKIAKKEVSAEVVYEDTDTIAFLDINPNNHGHTLVIPKDHFENIYTLPQEILCRLMITVQKLSIAIKVAVEADGVNVSMNNEKAAFQEVFHAHFHVIPRHDNDGFTPFPHKAYIGNEMQEVGKKVRKELK